MMLMQKKYTPLVLRGAVTTEVKTSGGLLI
jgi:hypothetical protein